MAFKALPPQDLLNQALRYEPETGFLFWKERKASSFPHGPKQPAEEKCLRWNSRLAGARAFSTKNGSGYFTGRILNKSYFAHRIIWKMVYGVDPEEIDHANGVRTDNRVSNLTSGDHHSNCKNMRPPSSNKSGVVGVWQMPNGRWSAYINAGRRVHLGCFKSKQSAAVAREKAEREYGYHRNHGK